LPASFAAKLALRFLLAAYKSSDYCGTSYQTNHSLRI